MKYGAIVKLIQLKGVDNVTIPETIRSEVMHEAGQTLFKEGKFEEAGKALARGNLSTEINAAADYLLKQGRFKSAAYFLMHTGDKEQMEICALRCMEKDQYQIAVQLFEATGNNEMIRFIHTNFQ